MRILAATLFMALALALPARAGSYTNARFGYTLIYPNDRFTPQPEAENGDGRHFTARSGAADLAVWGAYNALEQTPDDIAAQTTTDCTATPYRLVKPTVV